MAKRKCGKPIKKSSTANKLRSAKNSNSKKTVIIPMSPCEPAPVAGRGRKCR